MKCKNNIVNKTSFLKSVVAVVLLVTVISCTSCSGFIRSYDVIWGDVSGSGTGNNSGNVNVPNSGNSVDFGEQQTVVGVDIEKPDSQKGDGEKITSAGQAFNSITEVYYAVSDTVVEITTEIVQNSIWMGEYVSTGAGSGVIIDDSGIIVTNYHVIDGAGNVTVRLTDGSEYEAVLIGAHEAGDLAVIKIDAGSKVLCAAPLGCSADLEVGEDVVALGNPLGSLGGTLTTGIISATERTLTINGEEMTLLQTNAAINPGNSGGGLFNMAGQLIGIVNAKAAGDDIEGLGFAIPIDIAFATIMDLVQYGYVRGMVDHGLITLDVTAQNLPAAYRKYGITTTGIIVLESEFSDEILYGDSVTAIDGVAVSSSKQVEALLKSYSVGDTIKLSLIRNGKTVEAHLVLREKVPDSVKFE